MNQQPLLFLENLTKCFEKAGHKKISAVKDVSLLINKGELFSLVGESGCGKTTLARLILRLIKPDSGFIYFEGKNIFNFDKNEQKNFRKKVQIVFQNPYASLNPRIKVGKAIAEPLLIHKICSEKDAFERAREFLKTVGLSQDDFFKFPHQFSSGQRQRIAIARAIILKPDFLVLDEPVSSLDVTVQKQILELLLDIKNKFNLTFLFITHDIRIVSHISQKIAVMKEGQIIEQGETHQVLKNPSCEYTRSLLEYTI